MKKNMLGNTGIEVSELSFGTLILGKIQADLTVKEGGQTVKKAFELGINFFDTAPSYGTEAHLREGSGGSAIKPSFPPERAQGQGISPIIGRKYPLS